MQTIGERLEEARKRKGISIRDAADATKVRGEYLNKFESNQFDIGLPDIYVRGFLRTYATLLRLPPEKIVADYRSLGHTERAAKARLPGRELYGRMEISATPHSHGGNDPKPPRPASSSPSATGGAGAGAAAVATAEGGEDGAGIFRESLRQPFLDPAKLIRWGTILGGVLLVGIVIWTVSKLMHEHKAAAASPDGSATTQATGTDATQPADKVLTLVALDTVQVTVTQESDKRQLWQGTLARGETRPIPNHGAVFISTTVGGGKNLQIEVDGRRYPMPDGVDRARLE